MKTMILLNRLIIFIAIVNILGCSKFLDEKPDKTLKIPSTVQDLQSILDDNYYLNNYMPSYGLASCDDYYISEGYFNGLRPSVRNAYIWQNYHYTNFPTDWLYTYNLVNVCNNVLEAVVTIKETDQNKSDINNISGSALFFRSLAFYNGMGLYCKAYDPATAITDPGMVLKLTSSVDEKSFRSSMESTCRQILDDLKLSFTLLPDLPLNKMRPSKAAAATLLARTYLYMHKFDSSVVYASEALDLQNELMDYNDVDVNAYRPFSARNEEVIFHAQASGPEYDCISTSNTRIDSVLYKMFDEHDLRKKAFFESTGDGVRFKGMYNNSRFDIYQGITTDELYLIRAECNARLDKTADAIEDLNHLMSYRWEKALFVPFHAGDASEALHIILEERRKELIYRGLRWMDIKRLNQEGAGLILKRKIGSEQYELQPGSPYFALPLPEDLLQIAGIEQNKY